MMQEHFEEWQEAEPDEVAEAELKRTAEVEQKAADLWEKELQRLEAKQAEKSPSEVMGEFEALAEAMRFEAQGYDNQAPREHIEKLIKKYRSRLNPDRRI